MPGLDSTGPKGQGSQTGRKLGRCRNKTTSGDIEQGRGLQRGFRARLIAEKEDNIFGRNMRGVRGRGRGLQTKSRRNTTKL